MLHSIAKRRLRAAIEPPVGRAGYHQRVELKFQSSLRIQFDDPLFLASTHFPSSGYMYWPQLADAAATPPVIAKAQRNTMTTIILGERKTVTPR